MINKYFKNNESVLQMSNIVSPRALFITITLPLYLNYLIFSLIYTMDFQIRVQRADFS